jgi:hypothetical protein
VRAQGHLVARLLLLRCRRLRLLVSAANVATRAASRCSQHCKSRARTKHCCHAHSGGVRADRAVVLCRTVRLRPWAICSIVIAARAVHLRVRWAPTSSSAENYWAVRASRPWDQPPLQNSDVNAHRRSWRELARSNPRRGCSDLRQSLFSAQVPSANSSPEHLMPSV